MSEERILDRIRKLMKVTVENGATQSEMENAMKMAQQLMMRHNIDNDNLSVSENDINIAEVENTYQGHETSSWLWDLLRMIGEPYSCRILRRTKRRRGIHPRLKYETLVKYEVYEIIGTKDDREIVKEIFFSILPVIRNLRLLRWKEYTKNTPKVSQIKPATFAKSYFMGFVKGINEKLKADRDQFLSDSSDRSKWGLILVRKTDLVEAHIKSVLKPGTAKIKGTADINDKVYKLGVQDGNERNGNTQLMQSTN